MEKHILKNNINKIYILVLFFFTTSLIGFSQRTETNFNNNWKFILKENPTFSNEKVDVRITY